MFLTPAKYRLAAVFAVLSILLLFIAPLISQSLYLSHSSHYSQTEQRCNDDTMGNEEMAGAMMSHSMSAEKNDHIVLPASGMLCGYCELLAHFPFFAWIAAAILWLLSALSLTPPPLPYRTIVLTPCYLPQLSRGPPRA